MIDEPTQDEASLYVLGLLSPDEASRFESAMARNPELIALVAELESGAAALGLTVAPIAPPSELEASIMAAINQGGNTSTASEKIVPFQRPFAWFPWSIAACLALSTAWLGYERFHLKLYLDNFMYRDHRQQAQIDQLQSQSIALQQRITAADARVVEADKDSAGLKTKLGDLNSQLASLNHQIADLQAQDTLSKIQIATLASQLKSAPQAVAVVAWDDTQQRGIVKTIGIPAAKANQDYQLWIIDPGIKSPVSAGVFDPAQSARFTPTHPISKAGKFAISLEKKGGSDQPAGPIVLIGE